VTPSPRRSSATAVLGVAVALAAALAAVALANVTIYSNNFSSRSEARELDGPQARACSKNWRKGPKTLKVALGRGPLACPYGLPVQGVDALPDHDLKMKGKILTDTRRPIRDTAYIGLLVRAGGGQYYELRVFPRTHGYSLRRSPDGPGFPANGTDGVIRRVGKTNTIRLEVFGTRARAIVNGTELADVTDSDPGEILGTRLRVVVGNTGNTNKNTHAVLDDVKVAVPEP
jgi:hypothetical protein